MSTTLCAGTALITIGAFSLVATGLQWQWFRDNFRVRLIYQLLGERGGRIFYIALGVLFLVGGAVVCVSP
jgi:hypothetical protein